MAQEELRYKVSADTKSFVSGMNQVNSSSKKATGSTKKGSLALTQFAYALDDVQYGFRGVQNNLQAMAASLGLHGVLIIGITALGIALNKYFSDPKNVTKFFNAFKSGSRIARDETDKYIKKLRELQEIELTQDQKLIISNQNTENAAKKELELLDEIIDSNEKKFVTITVGTSTVRRQVDKYNKVEKQAARDRKKIVEDELFDAQAAKQDAIDRVALYDKQIEKEKELARLKKLGVGKGFDFKTGGLGFFGTGLTQVKGLLPSVN